MTPRMTLKQILLDEAESTYAITEKLFHRVADSELSWKPTTGRNWMTLAQLLRHCASFSCGKAIRGFVRGDWGPSNGLGPGEQDMNQHVPPVAALPGVESVQQALKLLADDRSLALCCIGETEETDLLAKKLVAPWGGLEVSLYQHLSLMIAHLAQHKGQLFYYLKLMGKDVDTSDLWDA
jgi:uncharacterized damage-inducible protein DinB